MRAIVALGGCAFVRIHINRIVRTRLHASLATNAALRTEIYDPVFALIHRRDRADRHARWLLAVIATRDLKNPAGVGIRSLFNILYPRAVHAERDLVFSLARNCTGVAPNALAIVYNEAVSHSRVLSGQTTLSHEAVRCLGVKLLKVIAVEPPRA
jgi:hypothetical protein